MFPAVFEAGESKAYVVSFPDLPDAILRGTPWRKHCGWPERLLKHLYSMEEEGDRIPEPTPPEKVKIPEGAFVAPVFAYMIPIRDAMANKAVNKTVTLPRWLNDLAEQRKVNFSGLLQTALKQYLGLLEAEHR